MLSVWSCGLFATLRQNYQEDLFYVYIASSQTLYQLRFSELHENLVDLYHTLTLWDRHHLLFLLLLMMMGLLAPPRCSFFLLLLLNGENQNHYHLVVSSRKNNMDSQLLYYQDRYRFAVGHQSTGYSYCRLLIFHKKRLDPKPPLLQ